MVRLTLLTAACLVAATNASCPDDVDLDLCGDDNQAGSPSEEAGSARRAGGFLLPLGLMLASGDKGMFGSPAAPLMLSAFFVAAQGAPKSLKCKDVKNFYKSQECCGNADQEITKLSLIPTNSKKSAILADTNPCKDKKPNWPNKACTDALEQAGGDVSVDYTGSFKSDTKPLSNPYFRNKLCPVNVHWHLGAEHRSKGQFDENGVSPNLHPEKHTTVHNPTGGNRRLAAAGKSVRYGFACGLYDANEPTHNNEYEWKHCVDMHVGETYEVHWPHSAIGMCHTPWQYQSTFYDGVFCGFSELAKILEDNNQNLTNDLVAASVGVQSQVFFVVNDEQYYYPDLIRGMIYEPSKGYGKDVVAYTGSSTGTTRDADTTCSAYAPISWHVDRKCQMISASSFDKMCFDMKQQADDMSGDLHPHGARELVVNKYVANNQAMADYSWQGNLAHPPHPAQR